MSYFFPGLWHLAAAMAFAFGLSALRGGDSTSLLSRPEFIVACVLGSSALFFIPDAWAKKGLMKFLHYPLPDWDVLLLGPASHRHWFTHSPILPLALFWLSTRFSFAPHAFAPHAFASHSVWANAACGLSIGLSSHLFWDCVSSRSHKIVFVPYWMALRPALSRIYLLGGALLSLLVALWFGSVSSPLKKISLPSFLKTDSSTRNIVAPRFQLVDANNGVRYDGAKPVKVADVRTPEGVSFAPDGTLFAVENIEGGNIVRIRNGKAENWLSSSTRAQNPDGRPNGTKFWGKTLFFADSGLKQIWAIAPDKTVQVIVDARRGECVNGPNDLAFDARGNFYFTDPLWDHTGNVYFCHRVKGGKWTTTFFAGELYFPNGVAVAPDGHALFVGETQRNRIWKIEIKADGSEGHKRVWCVLPTPPHSWNGPDGMRFDNRGRLFVAQYGNHAIQVISPQGRVLETLDAGGQNPTNVAFSRDQKTLYVSETETNAIYKIDLTKDR